MTPPSTNVTVPVAAGDRDVHVVGVAHTYASSGGPVHALAELDLAIGAGEFVCVVGPSGCGKSTLLDVIAGLRRPSQGQVLLGDKRIIGPSRRRGVVFQQSASLAPWLTVAGNVEFGLRLNHVPKAARRARVHEELARVGLTDFADRRIYELSGGMQQRVQIARALANDPDVLLLDEPFGALDAFTREHLQGELRQIWRDARSTVLFVTHSVEEAALLSTRVLVMSARPGRVVADRAVHFTHSDLTVAELRGDPAFVEFCTELRSLIAGSDPYA